MNTSLSISCSIAIFASSLCVTSCAAQAANEDSNRELLPHFDKDKDLLLAQFDCKPDADDLQANAALGSILLHPDGRDVKVYGVAGAFGRQQGKYINPNTLFALTLGSENIAWTDAHADWKASVTRVAQQVTQTLDAGGRVWVQEAGQSNFTADWIEKLISEGVSETKIKEQVYVVQHSHWNEKQTSPADLTYVQDKATYIAIDDGNTNYGTSSKRADRGPYETPKYVSAATNWLEDATASTNQNRKTRAIWTEAVRLIEASGFEARYSVIDKGGVDFSDCVENWFILGLSDKADSVEQFWQRYVVL